MKSIIELLNEAEGLHDNLDKLGLFEIKETTKTTIRLLQDMVNLQRNIEQGKITPLPEQTKPQNVRLR